MSFPTNIAPHMLLAIIRIAREECAHSIWAELEPRLAASWEELRDDETPSWDIVADEIERVCAIALEASA